MDRGQGGGLRGPFLAEHQPAASGRPAEAQPIRPGARDPDIGYFVRELRRHNRQKCITPDKEINDCERRGREARYKDERVSFSGSRPCELGENVGLRGRVKKVAEPCCQSVPSLRHVASPLVKRLLDGEIDTARECCLATLPCAGNAKIAGELVEVPSSHVGGFEVTDGFRLQLQQQIRQFSAKSPMPG